MKKILLVGELNQTVSSVNKHLSTRFQTQICMDKVDLVRGMAKIFEPDMAVICLVGVGQLDNRVLDFFQNEYTKIPVLLIGTAGECNHYQKYYESEQFDFAVRPTTLSALLLKCLVMLKMADTGEMAEPVKEEAEQPKDEKRRHILAVDDSGVLLRSVKAMLEKDYDVSTATSGMKALKKAQKDMPDLILLDYEMPEWDGKKTLEEIRNDEQLKDIPVVFLTAVADKSHIMAVLGMKPSGYLLKPIEPQKLLNTIDTVLRGIL